MKDNNQIIIENTDSISFLKRDIKDTESKFNETLRNIAITYRVKINVEINHCDLSGTTKYCSAKISAEL